MLRPFNKYIQTHGHIDTDDENDDGDGRQNFCLYVLCMHTLLYSDMP